MVGKNKKVSLLRKLIGTPYKLGSLDPKEGLDCLSFMLNFSDSVGQPLPKEFDGITDKTYPDLWRKDKREAAKRLIRFIASNLEEVDKHRSLPGDVLICNDGIIGINAGNGHIVTVIEDQGVKVLKLSDLKVKRAFRWVEQP